MQIHWHNCFEWRDGLLGEYDAWTARNLADLHLIGRRYWMGKLDVRHPHDLNHTIETSHWCVLMSNLHILSCGPRTLLRLLSSNILHYSTQVHIRETYRHNLYTLSSYTKTNTRKMSDPDSTFPPRAEDTLTGATSEDVNKGMHPYPLIYNHPSSLLQHQRWTRLVLP